MPRKKTEAPVNTPFAWVAAMIVLSGLDGLSALGVVYSTYEARQKVHKLEVLRRENAHLLVKQGQLILEKSAWEDYSRVEKIAKFELDMVEPLPEDVEPVTR